MKILFCETLSCTVQGHLNVPLDKGKVYQLMNISHMYMSTRRLYM